MSAAQTDAGEELRRWVREIPDFPKDGIGYKDITPVLASP